MISDKKIHYNRYNINLKIIERLAELLNRKFSTLRIFQTIRVSIPIKLNFFLTLE